MIKEGSGKTERREDHIKVIEFQCSYFCNYQQKPAYCYCIFTTELPPATHL